MNKSLFSCCVVSLVLILLTVQSQALEVPLAANKTKPRVDLSVSPGNVIYHKTGSYTVQSDETFTVALSTSNFVGDPQSLIPSGLRNVIWGVTCGINPDGVSINGEYGLFQGDEHYMEKDLTLSPTVASDTWAIEGTLYVTINYQGQDANDNWVIDEAYEGIHFYVEVVFMRNTSFSYGVDSDTLAVEAFKHSVDSYGIGVREPHEGVIATPRSYGLTFTPRSTSTMVTDKYGAGDSGVALFQIITPIGTAMESSGVAGETVTVQANQTLLPPHTIPTYFAEVISVTGTVETTDPLSGQVTAVTPGMRLAPGARLRGERFVRPDGTWIPPNAKVRFCNGVVEDIQLVDNESQQLSVLLGSSGVTSTGKRYSRFEIMLKDIAYQAEHEPRQLAAHAVSQAFGKLTGALTGGWSMVVGNATTYAVDKYYHYSQSNTQPRTLSQTVATTAAEEVGPGERYTWSLYDDGSYGFENYGPSLMVSTSDGREYLVPSGASRKFSREEKGEPEKSKALAPPWPYANPQTIVMPANGSTVTRTPSILIDHNLGVQKDSLACWVNGFNIGSLMQVQPSNSFDRTVESRFVITPEMRLPEGENTIEFRGRDERGTAFRASSTFIATGKPEVPEGFEIFPGVGKMVLRWRKNREHDLAGYRVYSSDSKDGGYELVSQVGQPVFRGVASATIAKWYAVTAFDLDDIESELSAPVSGRGLMVNEPLSAADSPLQVVLTAQNHSIRLEITGSISKTACWRLERASDGGNFINIVDDGQGLFYSRLYDDTDVTPGVEYTYRLTALNGDLIEGTQTLVGPAEALDLPPAPPRAVSADLESGGARIRWNSSPDAPQGYKLYVKTDTGVFTAVEGLINDNTTLIGLLGNRVYQFALSSVDAEGREGTISVPVELTTWGTGLPTRDTSSSSILLLLAPLFSGAGR